MIYPIIALPVLAVYILAAVIPAVILLRYVYRHDTVEKEPLGLLLSLLLMGVVAALASGILERIAQGVLGMLVRPGSLLHTVLLAFLVVAVLKIVFKRTLSEILSIFYMLLFAVAIEALFLQICFSAESANGTF